MYLNTFSSDLQPLDLTGLEEFASLLDSARDLDIEVPGEVRYVSRNTVLRHQRFHFLEWGREDAPPMVLLHGGNQSAHSWDLVSLHLSSDYRVMALDQRGHGDSEWNRGAHYAIADMMPDARDFLGALGLARPVVVGHSMGGMVALALACAHPQLVRAAVIVDIGPEVGERGARMIREFVGRNIEFDDMEAFLDRVEQYDRYRTRAHIERTLKYNLIQRADGRYITKADRRRYAAASDGDDAEAGTRLPGVPDLAAVSRLEVPVLVVRGGNSNVLEQAAAERFVAALPHGELKVVPDCGHNVASQNTAGFLGAVKPFLDEHVGGAT